MYLVKWTDIYDGVSVFSGLAFDTPEKAAEYIKEQVLSDLCKGVGGSYIYEISEREF